MKIWQKTIAVVATFALLFNFLNAPLTVLAQETTPEPTPIDSPKPEATAVEATIEATTTPKATTTTPQDSVTPAPTDPVSPTAIPEIQTEVVITDKLDYSPTDSTLITGVGFTAGKTYTINITSSGAPAVNFSDSVTANDKGEILYSYSLDGNYRPNYLAVIKDGEKMVAETTFTDTTISTNPNPITNPATNISSTDATLNGTNGDIDATRHSFWVSTAPFVTTSTALLSGVYSTPDLGPVPANTAFSAPLTSALGIPAVTPGTICYFAAWSEIGGIWWYPGGIQSFTTASPDTTPPVITYDMSPAPNATGWNNLGPTVTWTVTDPESAITSQTGCETQTITGETSGQVITCSATSIGGTSSNSMTIKLDTTAPSAPVANPAGGNYSSDQTVSITAETGATIRYTTDGVAPTDSTGVIYTGTILVGADVVIKAIAYDNAGNASDILEAVYKIVPEISSDPDICKNIDGIQTGVPDGMHINSTGHECVNYELGGAPAPSGNGREAVLGISTSVLFKSWPRLASTGSGSAAGNDVVLGTETNATASPEASALPTPQPEKTGTTRGVSLLLLLIAYGLYHFSRKKK